MTWIVLLLLILVVFPPQSWPTHLTPVTRPAPWNGGSHGDHARVPTHLTIGGQP